MPQLFLLTFKTLFSVFSGIFKCEINRCLGILSGQTGKFVFCTRKIFSPVKFVRLERLPSHLPIRNGIFFQFCALHWSLHAWQFACARKIFSVYYILFSLADYYYYYYLWEILSIFFSYHFILHSNPLSNFFSFLLCYVVNLTASCTLPSFRETYDCILVICE